MHPRPKCCVRPDYPALFRLDGERFIGNDASRGPWAADARHAGPVTCTIVRARERVVPDQRPVPAEAKRGKFPVQRALHEFLRRRGCGSRPAERRERFLRAR
jgi:hypothetical protein